MPNKWEYPWYAAWDLAFHTLPISIVDPDFAKQQMQLMLRAAYLHPSGQIPAYEWNSGRHTVSQAPPTDHDAAVASPLTPLIMFAAGPGTITAVVTLAAVHTPDSFPVTAIVAATVGAGATFATLLLAIRMGSHLGESAQALVTRFMGLIVASMGMQFVL